MQIIYTSHQTDKHASTFSLSFLLPGCSYVATNQQCQSTEAHVMYEESSDTWQQDLADECEDEVKDRMKVSTIRWTGCFTWWKKEEKCGCWINVGIGTDLFGD